MIGPIIGAELDVETYLIEQALAAPLDEVIDKNDRRTPRWFFDQCKARYGLFQIDIAANVENALCPVWFGPGSKFGQDALAVEWNVCGTGALCWGNIPYGPPGTIPKWLAHARTQRDRYGIRSVFLLPADVSTLWYQEMQRYELVENVPFRIAFEAPHDPNKNSALFASCLVVIAPKFERRAHSRRNP